MTETLQVTLGVGSPFSPEIPGLLCEHFAEIITGSGVSVEVARTRGYESVLGAKRLADLGFALNQRRAPGYLLPVYAPGLPEEPALHQYKPNHPRKVKEKAIKYETPTGAKLRIDCPRPCQPNIGNPAAAVWITEGIKKVDCLASHGLFALGLLGVYGFRSTNELGGKAISADLAAVHWKGRRVFLVFDSDILTKQPVRNALRALGNELDRRGAEVFVVFLPQVASDSDKKVGVDDYLIAGHTVEDMEARAEPLESGLQRHVASARNGHGPYDIVDGCLVHRKIVPSTGDVIASPLSNFVAAIVEDITLDDDFVREHTFRIRGRLSDGSDLPTVDIPAAKFNSLTWVPETWGSRPTIEAGQSAKDHVRAAIQYFSKATQRFVYARTGWAEIGGTRVFLTSSGALGGDASAVVTLPGDLRGYSLPLVQEAVKGSIEASFKLLHVATEDVMVPLLATIYGAPLGEELQMAHMLNLSGPSGALKTELSLLALRHWGTFLRPPLNWESTTASLEHALAKLKDVPTLIDDLRPTGNARADRDMRSTVDRIIRMIGNKVGRGRLNSDLSRRPEPYPRGLVIATSEQQIAGHSTTARVLNVPMGREKVHLDLLTEAQANTAILPDAMASYILWLARIWDPRSLHEQWLQLRSKAASEGHLRLASEVASLQVGFMAFISFAAEVGAITETEADHWELRAWDVLRGLTSRQGETIDAERPANVFRRWLEQVLTQGTYTLRPRLACTNAAPEPGRPMIGWRDPEPEGCIYLDPQSVYSVVCETARRAGFSFPWQPDAVWADLKRSGISECSDDPNQQRSTSKARCEGNPRWVIKIRKATLGLGAASTPGDADE